MKRLRFIISFFGLLFTFVCFAEDDYADQDIRPVQMEQGQWEKIVSDRDYSEIADPTPKEDPDDDAPEFDWAGLTWLKYLMITLLVAFVTYLLVKIINSKDNTRVSEEEVSYSRLEELEGDLAEADLHSFLSKALESADYRLAFRVLYLIALQEMGQRKWIDYRKDKTNFHYVLEMGSRPEVAQFTRLTKLFDLIWYGEHELGKAEFERIDSHFDEYIRTVRGDGH